MRHVSFASKKPALLPLPASRAGTGSYQFFPFSSSLLSELPCSRRVFSPLAKPDALRPMKALKLLTDCEVTFFRLQTEIDSCELRVPEHREQIVFHISKLSNSH